MRNHFSSTILLGLLAFGLTQSLCAFGGDPLVQVSPDKVDMSKEDMHMNAASSAAFRGFASHEPKKGEIAPDFTLRNLAGDKVTLSQFQGKTPVLLVFGSASCFVFRRAAMPNFEVLKQMMQGVTLLTGKTLEILYVYTIEAHPVSDPSPYTGTQWISQENMADKVLVHQPKGDLAQRLDIASAFAERYKLDKSRILIDEMDNAVWKKFGSLPDEAYLLDKDGRVVYKEPWALQTPNHEGNQPALIDAIRSILQ